MLHTPPEPYDESLAGDKLPARQTLVYRHDDVLPLRERLKQAARQGRWKMPLLLFCLGLLVYALFAWERLAEPSPDTHFVYLANTYNTMIAANFDDKAAKRREGKLPFELDRKPPHRNDWASWRELELRSGEVLKGNWFDRRRGGSGRFKTLDGNLVLVERSMVKPGRQPVHYYVSFPPGPALLMMPLAAIWGYGVNDVWFTLFFAALNIALLYMLMRRMGEGGRTGRAPPENLWLTALFALGSVHLWCGVLGQVWFTALIVGVSFALIYILAALDARHPLIAGLAMAMGFATRTPLLFTSIFFFAFVFFPGGRLIRREDLGWAIKKLAWFCLPCLAMGLWLLWMNDVRFGSLTEFGHRYLAGGQLGRIKKYGLFNFHFLSKNLTALFTLMPRIQPSAPYILISKHGMSLLLVTPALFWIFKPRARELRPDVFWWRLLWIVVAVTAIPGLLYQNTGYEQFSFRFSLDYMPYLLLLIATGRAPLTRWFKLAVIWGILANSFGAITFKRMMQYYSEAFFV